MFRFIACFALLISVAVAAPAQMRSGGTIQQLTTGLNVAQKLCPSGQLVQAQVESKGGATVYGFYFLSNGKTTEIEVDANGTVVKNTDVDKIPVNPEVVTLIDKLKLAKAKLPDGRLLEIAGDALKDGKITSLKYAKQGDSLVLKVGDVVIDASNGKIIPK